MTIVGMVGFIWVAIITGSVPLNLLLKLLTSSTFATSTMINQQLRSDKITIYT